MDLTALDPLLYFIGALMGICGLIATFGLVRLLISKDTPEEWLKERTNGR